MNLVVYCSSATHSTTGQSRCGIVIVDSDSLQTVGELSGDLLSPGASRAAVYEALLMSVEPVVSLSPDEVVFRTTMPWLFDQLTGRDFSDDPLFERLQAALLRVDLWRIAMGSGAGVKRSEELARG